MAEPHREDGLSVPPAGANLLTGRRVPDLDRAVGGRRDDSLAVGAVRHGQDGSARADGLGWRLPTGYLPRLVRLLVMALQLLHLLAGFHVPHPHEPVLAGGGDA